MAKKIFLLCVLSGKYTPQLTQDKKRLLTAKRLSQKLSKNKSQIKIIFCAYKEIKKEARLLMKKIFSKDFAWAVIADKSFKIVNTKEQINTLKKKFMKNKKMQIIIISDNWHLARIKYYLKFYQLNQWQVYAKKDKIYFSKIFSELIKIIFYYLKGNLQI